MAIQLGILLIGSKSIPIIMLEDGMYLEATCIQPPGAAQRSTKTLAFYKKLYFWLICRSLKAALDRYPYSFASL